MGPLIAFSRGVDSVNAAVGRVADWLVLLACAVSAGNAFVRYRVSYSSNAWLEVQWYFFAGIIMLGASYTLFRNEHVRVDLVYGNLGERARLWVDVFCIILFLLPATVLLAWMTWPFFLDSFVRNEGSPNAGGLLRWPIKIVIPLGFVLLAIQGVAEIIKKFAVATGVREPGKAYERPVQ